MFRLRLSLLFFVLPLIGPSAIANERASRLQAVKPDSGPYVKSDRGYLIPYEERVPGTNQSIRMIPVPGGTVTLQPPSESPNQARAEGTNLAKPMTVTVAPFWISEAEITMEQFMPYRRLYYQIKKAQWRGDRQPIEFGDVDGISAPSDVYAPDVHFQFAGKPNSPVLSASQFAARQYTKWLSRKVDAEYCLPMRSQWQHACHAKIQAKENHRVGGQEHGREEEGDSREAAHELEQHAVYADNSLSTSTLLVKTKRPNAWGLFDMRGNAAEWVIEDTLPFGLRNGHVAMGGHFESTADDCQCDSMIRSTDVWWDEDPDFPRSPWWMTSDEGLMTSFRIVSPLVALSDEEKRRAWEPDSKSLSDDLRLRLREGRGTFGRVSP